MKQWTWKPHDTFEWNLIIFKLRSKSIMSLGFQGTFKSKLIIIQSRINQAKRPGDPGYSLMKSDNFQTKNQWNEEPWSSRLHFNWDPIKHWALESQGTFEWRFMNSEWRINPTMSFGATGCFWMRFDHFPIENQSNNEPGSSRLHSKEFGWCPG